ncbi:hypothetical protein CGZ80_16420 [Rhodopirellula sp. MGV]|nr:hypothetical protein CGZ80_16420 [Rhodopirellula sp. MGV]
MRLIAKFLMRTVNGCEISGSAVLAESVFFPHPLGIVIGDGVTVGAGTMIWQHVTLGSHGKAGAEPEYPVIGKNVRIYCNSVIIGGITIGDGAVIGACSLVLRDVAPGETVAGIPAKVVRTKSSETQG